MEKIMQHRLATPVFQPRMYFFDADGKPLVGGKAYSFKVGTDEFKPTYRNSEFTAANQNPVLLDQAGSALIYVRGSNQLKIYNKQGNLIEEKIVYQQQMQTQFFDNYGKALSNGKIWTYDYQSTIKKASYKNADEALLNSNPVVLDQNGWGSISIVGAYRLRVLNKNNVVIGDQDFKRPPVQVLTSRIYPVYQQDDFKVELSLNSSTSKLALLGSESKGEFLTSFSFNKVLIHDQINRISNYKVSSNDLFLGNFNNDQLTVSLGVNQVRLKINTPITLPVNDSVVTDLSINILRQKQSLITHSAKPDAVSSTCTINLVRIIQ